jgi:hypothetical protein
VAVVDREPRTESTAELIQRVFEDAQHLIDKQVELAKQELREDLQQVTGGAKTLGIGGGLLLIAAICFFNFLFLAIDRFLPGAWGWLVALIICLGCGIAGVMLLLKAKREMKVEPLARTRDTLKEDAEWARHRLTRNGKSSPSERTSTQRSESSNDEFVARRTSEER